MSQTSHHQATHSNVDEGFYALRQTLVVFAHPPCILVLVVHNAATMGATDRFLLGPAFAETAEQHPSSCPLFWRSPNGCQGQCFDSAEQARINKAGPTPTGRMNPTVSPTPEQQIHVGIDVSKRILDVCLLPEGESFTLANDQEGVEELLSRLQKVAPKLVVLEATGRYERLPATSIASAGIAVAVVNPRQARDFAKAMGRLAKTDKIDAFVLARLARAVEPSPKAPFPTRKPKLCRPYSPGGVNCSRCSPPKTIASRWRGRRLSPSESGRT